MLTKRFSFVIATFACFVIATSAVAASPSTPEDRVGLSKDLIYFVFPDRYLNGDTSMTNSLVMTLEIQPSFMAAI